MNWEAVGAIGELVSAIGVIGTLIYLAVQIRNSTMESRLIANADISRDYNSLLQHISDDKELSKLWVSALEDFDSLSVDEKARAIMLNGNMTRILENAYQQFKSGRMTAEAWVGYEKLLKMGVSASVFPHYWKLRKDLHNQSFQVLIQRLMENPDTNKLF